MNSNAEVQRLNSKLVKAYLQNDEATREQIFADLSRTESLDALNSEETEYEFARNDDVDVRVHQNTAVVTSSITKKQESVGSDRLQYTRVFVKQQEHWKIVAVNVSQTS